MVKNFILAGIFISLIFLTRCSGRRDVAVSPASPKYSQSQSFLIDLNDSLVSEYNSLKTDTEKVNILETYHQKLLRYLQLYPLDSISVTFDTVSVNGRNITTKSHFGSVKFEYSLGFGEKRSPKIDSIFNFMKNLKEGRDTLVSFSFTGACRVERPDRDKRPIFMIYAFPIPLRN